MSTTTPTPTTKVVVTGGSGLYGQGIQAVASEASEYEFVYLSSKDADLRDPAATLALFKRLKPDAVIHLAANVGGLFKNMEQRVAMFTDNMAINTSVLTAAHAVGAKKVISCLSTCIFPDSVAYPIDESMIHDGPPHESNEGYAYAKRMIDVMNRCYSKQYGSVFTSVVPTNVFGPHDNFHLNDSHVIPGMIHRCYLAMQAGEPFTVWGSGSPLRQFIFSHDLARLTIEVLRNHESTDPVILSVGEEDEISIKDVALAIVDAMDFKGEVVFDTDKADGQHKKTVKNDKIRGMVPGFEFTPFHSALKTTVEWFLANYETPVLRK